MPQDCDSHKTGDNIDITIYIYIYILHYIITIRKWLIIAEARLLLLTASILPSDVLDFLRHLKWCNDGKTVLNFNINKYIFLTKYTYAIYLNYNLCFLFICHTYLHLWQVWWAWWWQSSWIIFNIKQYIARYLRN